MTVKSIWTRDDVTDENDDDDGHLGAGEVSVSEVVEYGVHGVMLATPRGNLVIITINNNNNNSSNITWPRPPAPGLRAPSR